MRTGTETCWKDHYIIQLHVAYGILAWKPYRKKNNAYNMRYIDPCANDGFIIHTARSIDYADPSIALRTHHVGREICRFTAVNVNKVDIFYGIVLIQLPCCSFRCTL